MTRLLASDQTRRNAELWSTAGLFCRVLALIEEEAEPFVGLEE